MTIKVKACKLSKTRNRGNTLDKWLQVSNPARLQVKTHVEFFVIGSGSQGITGVSCVLQFLCIGPSLRSGHHQIKSKNPILISL